MKRLIGIALAAIVTGGTSALAADLPADNYVAPPVPAPITWNGWYFSLHGGVLWFPATTVDCLCGDTDQMSATTDTGFRLGGAIGYDFNPNFGVEAEVSYGRAGLANGTIIDGGSPLTGPLSGDVSTTTVMANAILSAPMGNWRPYVGAGAGFAYVQVTETTFADGINDAAGTWAAQFLAGIDYAFANGATIGGRYRYQYIGATDMSDGGGDPVHIDHIQAHSAEIVLKVPFGR